MIIYRKAHRVLVQGITGKQGTFWTEKMIECGTRVVAGVNPRRAGESHIGVPIFATTAEAAAAVGADVAVMFIPPPMAKDAAVSAAEAGVKLLVVLTEHIPAQDVMAMHAAAARHGTRIVGPNTAGLVTPGECFGEMAYLARTGNGRTAEVSTMSDAQVITIRTDDLEMASDGCRHRFDRAFMGILVERLDLANTRLTSV